MYLRLLNTITHSRPEAIKDVLRAYYTVVGQCCRRLTEDAHLPELVQAVTGPLDAQSTCTCPLSTNTRLVTTSWVELIQLAASLRQHAYHELVASFLVQPDLSIFEKHILSFSNNIDIVTLSEAVVTCYLGGGSAVTGQDTGLWLLAHFIALLRANPHGSLHSINLKALYIQLSALSSQIRIAFAPRGEEAAAESPDGLPQYVHDRLSSLVRKEGISDLLERFTL